MPRLLDQDTQPQPRPLVGDPPTGALLIEQGHELHRIANLGDLMSRVIDVLIGDFDVHARESVKAQGVNSSQFDCE